MLHRDLATTLGLLAIGWLAFSGEAMAASPIGYWLKEDGAAKLKISQCGRNQLCSEIVWLRDPHNDQGQPLRDARNENPSLRNRPIIGLPIFQGLAPAGSNTWKGQIYNPEDGGTYKATLTLVSGNQIVLKGCMAMFLCGQKTWTRTQFNPEPEAPEEIEVKEETEEASETAPIEVEEKQDEADKPRQIEASLGGMPSGFRSASSAEAPAAKGRDLQPVLPPAHRDATAGYGFVLTTSSPESAPEIGHSSPSSMYLVSPVPAPKPIRVNAATTGSTRSIDERPAESGSATAPRNVSTAPRRPIPPTEPTPSRPAPQSEPASAAGVSSGSTADEPAYETQSQPATAVPMPNQRPAEIDSYAEADALANQDQLSWRERRRLRKLRRELPWLRGQEAAQQSAPFAAYR